MIGEYIRVSFKVGMEGGGWSTVIRDKTIIN